MNVTLVSRTSSGQTAYYSYNAHGDVTLLTNETGDIVATYEYDAFGKLIAETGECDNTVTYAGYVYDRETGLYYLNARMYDPRTGRFMQYDTYAGRTTDALSLNRYAYCQGNPLRYIDPTGHSIEEGIENFIDGFGNFFENILITLSNLQGLGIVGKINAAEAEYANALRYGGLSAMSKLFSYRLENTAKALTTTIMAGTFIVGGFAITAMSGGTLTVGGVMMAGVGMGMINAGVSIGLMTYNRLQTGHGITASVGDYLKTAALSFAAMGGFRKDSAKKKQGLCLLK